MPEKPETQTPEVESPEAQEAATETTESTEAPESQETTTAAQPSEEKTFTQADIEKVRREAANYRTKLREAEAKVNEFETAQLSEKERAERAAQEAQERASNAEAMVKRAAVTMAAAQAGFRNPADAVGFVKLDAVELDESGESTNARELVEAVLAERAYLGREAKDERPTDLKQVLKEGGQVPTEGELSPEQARQLLDSDPDAFNKAMDEGRIKGVATD